MAYRHSYEKEYEDFLSSFEEKLMDDPVTALEIQKGHIEKHYYDEGYLQDSIARLLDEGIRGAGVFMEDRDEALMQVADAIMYKINDVIDWQQRSAKEFDRRKDYHEFACTVFMGKDEVVGKGYEIEKDKFKEVETKALRFVLRRDFEADNGFFLYTAYPDLSERHAYRTGKEVGISEAIDSGLYHCKSHIQEAAIRNIGNVGGAVTVGLDQNRDEYLKIREGSHVAYLDQYGVKIYRLDQNEKTRISFEELKNENHPMAVKLAGIAKTYKKIQQEQLKQFSQSFEEKKTVCGTPLEERVGKQPKKQVKDKGERVATGGKEDR